VEGELADDLLSRAIIRLLLDEPSKFFFRSRHAITSWSEPQKLRHHGYRE
jgi:hypothetical protein